MTPDATLALRQDLPPYEPFHYYRDRESAWLLQAHLKDDTPVRAVRQTTRAKLLDRPLIKPLAAGGGGVLRHHDLRVLARADCVLDYDALSAPGVAALEAVYDAPWMDFEITYDIWQDRDWQWAQMSRPGANLVVQLGFPSDHALLLQRTIGKADRDKFECDLHPVRTSGRPTLAWARLDIDVKSGTALIEELQSDWLRFVRRYVRDLTDARPRSRVLRNTQAYEAGLTAQYDKVWAKALLTHVLILLRDRLGLRDVFMHQPVPGAMLKSIDRRLPPRSLYTDLPKSFCFTPTRDVPDFLRIKRRKHLRQLDRKAPLFWKMTF
ncbi:MAG: hypothetical protein AAGK79_00740 [Pseudomonadota bacterium]